MALDQKKTRPSLEAAGSLNALNLSGFDDQNYAPSAAPTQEINRTEVAFLAAELRSTSPQHFDKLLGQLDYPDRLLEAIEGVSC